MDDGLPTSRSTLEKLFNMWYACHGNLGSHRVVQVLPILSPSNVIKSEFVDSLPLIVRMMVLRPTTP